MKKFNKLVTGVICILSMFIFQGCGNTQKCVDDIGFEIAYERDESQITESDYIQADEIRESENVNASEQVVNDTIYVYVCGAVNNPGVYELDMGSRLFEAVEKAGGFGQEAEKTSLNLAREVSDGEQIVVLTKEQAQEYAESVIYGQNVAENVNSKNSGHDNGLVNINTATVEELTTIPGIGESRALSIIEYRETHGLFTNIESIKNVTGIKDGLFSKIKDKITV